MSEPKPRQLVGPELEALRAAVLRDLDWVDHVTEEYRRGLHGHPHEHSLQDLEHAVRGIRERIEKAKGASS